jgi:hypothetical protein
MRRDISGQGDRRQKRARDEQTVRVMREEG